MARKNVKSSSATTSKLLAKLFASATSVTEQGADPESPLGEYTTVCNILI